jgi:large subunit ribosomal protein L15e
MRLLLRIRSWEYRQLPNIWRVTRPHRLGYKAKQGYVVARGVEASRL